MIFLARSLSELSIVANNTKCTICEKLMFEDQKKIQVGTSWYHRNCWFRKDGIPCG